MQDNSKNNGHGLKVMYLLDNYRDPFAGTERQLYSLINGLDRNRVSPAMALFRHSSYIENNGFPCPVEVLGIYKLFSLRSLHRMIAFTSRLNKEHYDIVHIFFNDASIIAPVILKLGRLKIIISRRDMGFWYNWLNLAVLNVNRFFVDAAVTNCEAVKELTHKKENIPSGRIHVIYNGYDPGNPPGTSDSGSRISIDRRAERKLIGLVANIRPVKRISDLVHAVSMVRKKYPNIELMIIGGGDSSELKELAENLGIGNAVHFPGAQPNTPSLIPYFDIAVLCSQSEGLSNALIEYMFCQVPVVCTATGGNIELVIDNETGYLIPVGSTKDLAEKICRLLADPARAEIMARNARNFVEHLCDQENMLKKYHDLYTSLLCE